MRVKNRKTINILTSILVFTLVMIFPANANIYKIPSQQVELPPLEPAPDLKLNIRKFPFPYTGMLAISSDIDATSVAEFEDYHRFLNTHELTPYGQGLGLDIADSAWMYQVSNYSDLIDSEGHSLAYSMAYFQGVDTQVFKDADKIKHYFNVGWIDSLHTFGDFSRKDKNLLCTRDLADKAWTEMKKNGFMPKVWINHGTETNAQNFGAYLPQTLYAYQQGDNSQSPYYHTDLTLNNGIRFVWNSTGGVQYSFEDPLYPLTLRDGRQIWGFQRYSYDEVKGKRVWTWEPHEIPRQLTKPHLDELYQAEKYTILAQHLGKGNAAQVFNSNDAQALRLLKNYQDEGKILVAGTERLLNYARVHHYIRYEVLQADGKYYINLEKIADPVLGESVPTLEDIRGLTFYVNEPEKYTLLLDLKLIPDEEIKSNKADKSGNKSIGIKWFTPDYTDYTK
ncbi:hypothetical protein [Desulfitobacterium sp.]|uniref:hypothetical protein n=1 Tax=Desulfitobacterium sp. TaxID=49981 RepID=UPI002BB287C2|nr:hypothetical protein [Desulfitobacterium sp.]HVJ49743.1 hypothetical protein [Desulfitobacterium sp.]